MQTYKFVLHFDPQIFNVIEIGTVARPFQDGNLVFFVKLM